jgi:carbon-monoxide dehydrogenase small subunit
MPATIEISLSVNGRPVQRQAEPRMQLLELLREDLNLTGAHVGCEQGVCGACTVIVDGKPQRSCISYVGDADGSAVTTIEGLDNDPLMNELRAAFTKHHGLQCGFCTPGMLITARDIVTRLGAVSPARIREELSGNLCRCTGYVGIVEAIHETCMGKTPVAASAAIATSVARTAAPLPVTATEVASPSNQTPAPARAGPRSSNVSNCPRLPPMSGPNWRISARSRSAFPVRKSPPLMASTSRAGCTWPSVR